MPALRKITPLIRLLRPEQWYKAIMVWLPALFHGPRLLPQHVGGLVFATGIWVVASSLVYVVNDILDARQDAQRPDRLHRPLPSGEVSRKEAWGLAALLAALLALGLVVRAPELAPLVAVYLLLNLAYSVGLKAQIGVQQAIVAVGFWLRLASGGAPFIPIPVTPWASLFTLGLAYYLNCLKGLGNRLEDSQRPYRFAMGLGAALAGSLTLAALVAISLKRGVEQSMRFPQLPPLFCLIGMQRTAFQSFESEVQRNQGRAFLADPYTLAAMVLFALSFLY